MPAWIASESSPNSSAAAAASWRGPWPWFSRSVGRTGADTVRLFELLPAVVAPITEGEMSVAAAAGAAQQARAVLLAPLELP
jgi:hypothetical protein